MGWGARCAGCARWERGRGLAKKPATPRPAMRAHVRAGALFGARGGARAFFRTAFLAPKRGVGLHGLRRGGFDQGFDATPGFARVGRVYFRV